MAWGINGTPDTLGSAGDTIEITDLTSKIFNQFLCHSLHSGSADTDKRFNNDSNSVYAFRRANDGGAETTATSQTDIANLGDEPDDRFELIYGINISGEEKLFIGFVIRRAASGAGTAPARSEWVAKYVPSPDADVTQVNFKNLAGAGDYATSSNLSAIGTD